MEHQKIPYNMFLLVHTSTFLAMAKMVRNTASTKAKPIKLCKRSASLEKLAFDLVYET